jgi:hypothetical protein
MELGKLMHFGGFSVGGDLPEEVWKDLILSVVDEVGMTVVHRMESWSYPVDGKGGTGITLFQPITESFIALDIWPDHKGAYLMVCSCRYFDIGVVQDVIKDFGLKLAGCTGHTLGIPHGELQEEVGPDLG